MATALYIWTAISILIGAVAVIPSIMGFFGRNHFNVNGKTVLLTGASEGMGKSVAKQLAAKGASLIIVSRNVAKLEAALTEIKILRASAVNPSTQRFHYISADVSAADESTSIIKQATIWNNGQSPDIVWCIAGSSYPALFIETSTAKMRQQMDVNYWSCADMAHAILSEWLAPTAEKKDRHLIFTSSVTAFYSIVGYTPYAPAKAAIKSLSDTLAQEVLLYGDHVKIHTIFPGTILSAGFDNENKTKPAVTFILEESDPEQTPEQVAKKSIIGLENGDYLVTVGLLGAAMRSCAWGGSARNNWVTDTAMTWITSIAWAFIGRDLDGKVRAYGKKHGHPSTYAKKTSDVSDGLRPEALC